MKSSGVVELKRESMHKVVSGLPCLFLWGLKHVDSLLSAGRLSVFTSLEELGRDETRPGRKQHRNVVPVMAPYILIQSPH